MGLKGKFIFSIILFLIIFGLRFLCFNCQEINIKDLTQSSGSGPSGVVDDNRRQKHQLWKSVGLSLTVQDDTNTKHFEDQFSSDNNEETISAVVRRRPGNSRKRKRRPQTYSTERINIENNYQWRGQVHDEPARVDTNLNSPIIASTNSPRNQLNQQYTTLSTKFLEKIREPLEALQNEQKLYEIRDKQRKESIPTQLSLGGIQHSINNNRDKSYRKQYSQAKKEDSIVTELITDQQQRIAAGAAKMVGAADLKNILKNSGGLSLSEILQQKNLSLDDLLKGKQNALQAIQTTATTNCFKENCNSSDELTTKYTKPARRIPAGYLQSTTTIKPIERKITFQSGIQTSKKRNQIRNDIRTTVETYSAIDLKNVNNEKTPNIFEIATIATLRDNPPTRKNISYPSRTKLRNNSTSGKDNENLSTRKPKTTTKLYEEPTTTVPAYRRRTSFRPKLKFPNLQKPIKSELSSSESSSLSSESHTHESHRNKHNNNNEKENFSISYDSQEDLLDKSKKNTNFYPSASSFNNLFPTTTTKANQDSVEEKLKQTNPEVNTINNFDDLENLSNENVATLEELFADTSFKPEANNMNNIQVITPRIDRKQPPNKTNTTNIINNNNNNISIDIDNNNNNNKGNNYESIKIESSSITHDITEINPLLSLDLTSVQSIDDRTELLELMEDRRSGNRLFKVLAQRNMTLDELIEHRKRGSSQVHLTNILQQQKSATQIFPSTTKLQDNLDIVTAFENFPHFNLIDLRSVQPDEIKTDSQGSSYFTSIIDIEPTDDIYKEGRSFKGKPIMEAQKQQESGEITIEKLIKPLNLFPSWKSLSLASYAVANENNFLEHHNSGHHISLPNDVDILEPTILKIEDDVARAHDLLDLELSGHGFIKRNQNNDGSNSSNVESIHIPAGIQSAIIASSAIVAISLIIFLFIFITCRWRQKRRKKLSYIEHYNAMKSKLPGIISQVQQSTMQNYSNNNASNNGGCDGGGESSSSGYSLQNNNNNNCLHSHISTITFNGGRLSTMDPNSPEVHEYLYDAMRKPFQN